MPKQLFSNNASTTLASAITDVATTITVASGKGPLFNNFVDGGYELLTITDGTNYEIVKCTWRTSDTLTVTRAQESTTARAWPSGSLISGYITKGTLEAFRNQGTATDSIQIGNAATATGSEAISLGKNTTASATASLAMGKSSIASGASSISLGESASATAQNALAIGTQSKAALKSCGIGNGANNPDLGATIAAWTASTAYSIGAVRLIRSIRCVCKVAGTSGSSQPYTPNYRHGDMVQDGTVAWRVEPSNNQYDVALGDKSNSQNYSVAIGTESSAYTNAVAAGSFSFAGQGSIALGAYAETGAYQSIAIGNGVLNKWVEYSLKVGALPAMEHDSSSILGNEYREYVGLCGQISSEFMDLTGGATWSASTAIRSGKVIKPTTPNGCQYLRYDNNRNLSDPKNLVYTPSNTGSTEPTWPTTFNDSVTDGGGLWSCIPHDGSYVMNLPWSMLIEEVYFICYEATSITAQASISIGTTGDLTKIVNNQPTVGLTGDLTVTKWTLAQPVLVYDITIKINTLATGSKMWGRFMFRGFYT